MTRIWVGSLNSLREKDSYMRQVKGVGRLTGRLLCRVSTNDDYLQVGLGCNCSLIGQKGFILTNRVKEILKFLKRAAMFLLPFARLLSHKVKQKFIRKPIFQCVSLAGINLIMKLAQASNVKLTYASLATPNKIFITPIQLGSLTQSASLWERPVVCQSVCLYVRKAPALNPKMPRQQNSWCPAKVMKRLVEI